MLSSGAAYNGLERLSSTHEAAAVFFTNQAAGSTWRYAVDVPSEVLTRLSLFEPLQFRRRLPTAGGLDPQAATDRLISLLTIWTSGPKVWHSVCDVDSKKSWIFQASNHLCSSYSSSSILYAISLKSDLKVQYVTFNC